MKIQIAAQIYLKSMDTMKKILDLVGFRLDKKSKEFTYAKESIMDYTYNNLNKLFKDLEKAGLIKKCSCSTNIRKGYKTCDCKGSGWVNNE